MLFIKFITFILTFFSYLKISFAEIEITGYQEFFFGSASQSYYKGKSNHGIDQAGMSNGTYSRLTAIYNEKLFNGIEVSGIYSLGVRDCMGDKTDNCEDASNENSLAFSGNFGVFSVGETASASSAMLSRLTAEAPLAEPDSANYQSFYSTDDENNYGAANEVDYGSNAVKILWLSNIYNGLSFALSYTPNSGEKGSGNNNGQRSTATNSTWGEYNDVLSFYSKYAIDYKGIGVELVYGQQTGNAGIIGTNQYNDLEENSYSIKFNYGNLSIDYRKNEADNSGQIKNNSAGNDEGISICGIYTLIMTRIGFCNVNTNFTDINNLTNSSKLISNSIDYALSDNLKIGLLYFKHEQTANGAIRTDAKGVMSSLTIDF